MRVRRTASLLALCLALAVAGAGCDDSPRAWRFEDPVAVASAGRLYLFIRLPVPPGEPSPCACFALNADGSWSEVEEFRADYSTVAASDTHFYVFLPAVADTGEGKAAARPGSVVALRTDSRLRSGEFPWPFAWKVQAALLEDGRLLAFGTTADGELRLATLILPAEAAAKSEAAERTTAPARVTTTPAAATTSPARTSAPKPTPPEPAAWAEHVLRTEGQGTCLEVRAARTGARTWVFWSTNEPGIADDTLWCATLGPDGLERAAKLETVPHPMRFAASSSGEEPVVIRGHLPARLRSGSWLAYRVHNSTQDLWPAFEPVLGLRTGPFERARTLAAAEYEKKVRLFVVADLDLAVTQSRVLESEYDGQAWSPSRTALGHPVMSLLIDHFGAVAVAAAAALIIFGASLVRSRYLPRRVAIAGIEYALAPWWRRAGAYVCDFIIVLVALALFYLLTRRVPTGPGAAVSVFAFELLYFSACEARRGRTVGKWLFGLIVVSRNGGYPTWSEAVLRNLPRALVDSLSLNPLGWWVGSIILLNTRGSQRLGDLVAGTYVVRERSIG